MSPYIEEVAPDPEYDDDSDLVVPLLKNLVGRGLHCQAVSTEMVTGDPWKWSTNASEVWLGASVWVCLDALRRVDPTAAADAARQIVALSESAEWGEVLWTAATELGLDAQRIVDESREHFAARSQADDQAVTS